MAGSETAKLDAVIESAIEIFVGDRAGRSVAIECASVGGGQNTDVRLPAASLLKLPLVLAIHRAAASGELDLDAIYNADDLPASRYPSVFDAFDHGHGFSVRELCGLTLALSDNRSANLLIQIVGLQSIQQWLLATGCVDTDFAVGFHDHEFGAVGRKNVTTADDCLAMLRALETQAGAGDGMASSVHSSRLSARLPNDLRVRHKTGTLSGVVNDIGTVDTPQGPLRAAFLCDGAQDPRAAAADIADCMYSIWSALSGRSS